MTLTMNLSQNSYDIIVEKGALSRAKEHFNLKRRVLCVTDSNVPEKYSKTILEQCETGYLFTFESGEENKSFDTLRNILSCLVENGFTRSDCIVAVGGGVVGDIAGFASSIFMRGIDFYNVPTTLLSQLDSSIGGKTAIDFDGIKNIVGSFKQPKGVIVDIDVLSTLPKRHISNGLCESVKMAMTSDEKLFEMFEKGEYKDNLQEVIIRSLKIKKSVVEQDEKEANLRKILNFGHTVGHAIESESMGRLYHGECVGLGMLAVTGAKVRQRLLKVLDRLGLPTSTSYDTQKLLELIQHDKKMSGDNITVITVEKVGEYVMKTLPFSEFEKMLSEVK